MSGWLLLLGYSPISWKTKKQPTVSRSYAEAEYRTMSTITCELKWLKKLLGDLGIKHENGMRLYCDSQYALYIAQNIVIHERTKPIAADCHFVRDAITNELIIHSYVRMYLQRYNWNTCSQSLWEKVNKSSYCPSWAFGIFTLPSKGVEINK